MKLCGLNEVPVGDLKQFNVGGIEVLVVNLMGRYFCLDARCTHAGAPLAEGELNGEVLTCPWHGSRFNVTNGVVVRGPAEKPLKVYPNKIMESFIFIEL
jgi:nitrite reductase/ring-hydroxylating ferredoxin subunit